MGDPNGGETALRCALLDDARALGRAGRDFVERTYDWEACLSPLDEILDGAAR